MKIDHPYLLFLGKAKDHLAVKTAQGIVDWRRDWCLGQLRFEGCNADVGLDDMSLEEAAEKGVKTFVIGVVNPGGVMPPEWQETIVRAIELGMDIASGLHKPLSDVESIRKAAEHTGQSLFDVRLNNETFATGSGLKRPGKRILTVGTDCSIGKKYTALALEAELIAQGENADFRATGQTGVLIAGNGVAIDAVVADFISGAAEAISPANSDDHWDVIEGQGSLFHPSFAGVSLGLLHGSQPDALVMCHEPTRTKMRNVEQPMPDLIEAIEHNLACARLTNKDVRCVGISVNTSALDEAESKKALADISEKTGLPACDPMKEGVGPIIDHLLKG